MQNRWEVTVKQSNYDFNPFRESDHGKSFKTIANMYPSWKDEIPIANANQYDFYWPSPVAPEGDSFNYDYEELLCKDWGIPLDFVVYRQWTTTEETPILHSIAEEIGLVDAQTNVCLLYTSDAPTICSV